ncbi:bifunctional diaminohydroxyphosphoribosylaminopyrimidine deaminase/5-amino-6-(5-phosphoribosylamino)uracil reductase RibD [Maribellus sp. CM-23]|uniref:bifunctional diaminohydroxyphosphoribosylaminopyrimidine deaminase/5-amino-6-(5-phosphoribosylamino)uracil reductase RibD n=1 Tax=Maribellus sp. CM-23 TaxID=2781026 RepID=UPI001EFFE124|nr:bifunctional diaminohydroxyphosphoribosylaminopyrimidine deaminase/5-amino-6-(5-phosphoribosylamino)uracil reductase RibD [Maribellus sp. CM-23]MCE4567058.1 bifunctional diaminohydroxyphosphoribosylaminopyrimidine deaminase/5-amino-6-(5-phosphoribosylamino)uracil reductase RibD [Maribellus sp. CM-23]
MNTDEKYMQRCLELARKGAGSVSPNPMVGCVIVHNNTIIGEGYHERCGEAHAEVNAVRSVTNPELLTESTLYVTLEPCAHFGKTPPCSDLIVEKKIPKVVIGTIDPFAEVAGKGIEKLQKAGIEVTLDVLRDECRELNKRFFTFHQKQRPYIILKWAQTQDGFLDVDRDSAAFGEPTWITGKEALLRVHQLRAEEDAIMVGTRTAEKDDPSLTVRHCEGKNPLRMVLDRELRLSQNLKLFDQSTPTLVFNTLKNEVRGNTEYHLIDFQKNVPGQVLNLLYRKNILSLIVEGGRQLLQSFIDANLWDEAQVYTGAKTFGAGVPAPLLDLRNATKETIGNDLLQLVRNRDQGS